MIIFVLRHKGHAEEIFGSDAFKPGRVLILAAACSSHVWC